MGNIALQLTFSRFSSAVLLGCCFALMASAFVVPLPPAWAEGGPFADFAGLWSGAGTLRPENGAAEQIRCNANYSQRGSSQREVDLQLRCASDSYNFDMTGEFSADKIKPSQRPLDRTYAQRWRYRRGQRARRSLAASHRKCGLCCRCCHGDAQQAAKRDHQLAWRRTNREGLDYTEP